MSPRYRWHWREEEDLEYFEGYRSGGYHPVLLDTTYRNRYRVVHKLGHGSYSAVWLARDCVADRFVALKFITASASADSKEGQVMKHIDRNHQQDIGRKFVVSLLDEFTLNGPNGNHACLVGQALGPTISDVKKCFDCDLLPLDTAKRITVQLALGLAYIHSCGIVHGGKLGPSWRLFWR